jgi:hypothetical protein
MADNHDNPLAQMASAELHDEGLGYLLRSRQLFESQPSPAAAASLALAHFFAALSADALAAAAGAHRTDEMTPPHGVKPVRPNEFTGHHG